MDVHGARGDERLLGPDFREDFIAGGHISAMADEHSKKLGFLRSEANRNAVFQIDGLWKIRDDVAELYAPNRSGLRLAGPPQQRVHPR